MARFHCSCDVACVLQTNVTAHSLRVGFVLANLHAQQQFKNLPVHVCLLPQSPSPPSALTCSALFYPRGTPPHPADPHPCFLTAGVAPSHPCHSPQSRAPGVSPGPLPGDSASGHHSSLLPFKDMERRRLLLSLTKKRKGSKSYLPIREFAGLTYSGPREKKVRPE